MYRYPKGDDHHGSCTAVVGDISPTALCDYFESRERVASSAFKSRYRKATGGGVMNQAGQHAPGLHNPGLHNPGWHYERPIPKKYGG